MLVKVIRRITTVAACVVFMCTAFCAEDKPEVLGLASDALRDVGDLTSPASLWRSRAFVTIAANSVVLRKKAIDVIESPSASEEQKQIVVYGMQTLPTADYFWFFDRVADLYARGKCSDPIIALTIDPGFEWGRAITENYKNAFVAEALRKVLSNAHATPGIKALVDEVASGKRFSRLVVYLQSQHDGGSNPRIPMDLWLSIRDTVNTTSRPKHKEEERGKGE